MALKQPEEIFLFIAAFSLYYFAHVDGLTLGHTFGHDMVKKFGGKTT